MINISHIDCQILPAEAWANGGGATRTLGREDAADGSTLWRVSLATLDGSSGFSRFPGLERIFVLVDQDNVDLHLPDGTLRAQRGHPVHFSGDLPVWLTMQAAPAHALNVMTCRKRCHARVEIVTRQARMEPAATHFLVNLSGTWRIAGAADGAGATELMPLQALRLDHHDSCPNPLELAPSRTGPCPLLASIVLEIPKSCVSTHSSVM